MSLLSALLLALALLGGLLAVAGAVLHVGRRVVRAIDRQGDACALALGEARLPRLPAATAPTATDVVSATLAVLQAQRAHETRQRNEDDAEALALGKALGARALRPPEGDPATPEGGSP